MRAALLSTIFCASTASAVLSQWNNLQALSDDADVNKRLISEDGDAITIDVDAPIIWYTSGSKMQVLHGTHPPQPYLRINSNNTFSEDFNEGTEGFAYDRDADFFTFEGKQSFGICKDNGRLYARAPPADCNSPVAITLHSVPINSQ